MEKIETSTPDITEENIKKIIELFPQVATEVETSKGELERAIDFDALRELLGDVAEGQRERYQFTWPGKREAKAEARRPINKTMIPCPEKSVDWDTTANLYIEGDNLDALKIMRQTYAGSFDLIYIDPPYNTGSDLIYDDAFNIDVETFINSDGSFDDEGNRLVKNLETNGRFHSDWCSMIYPRLILARDFLTPNGVIAISIGYQEVHNLIKICNEAFPDKTVLAITVQTSGGKPNSGFNISHEYVVFVAPKDFNPIASEDDRKEYSSPYHGMNLATFSQTERPNQVYPIFVSSEGIILGTGKTLSEMIKDGDYQGIPGDYQYDFSLAPKGSFAIWPISSKNEQCVWRLIPDRLMSDWKKGYIKVVPQPDPSPNQFGIQYLSGGIISKIESGELETYRISDDDRIPTIEVKNYKTAADTIPTLWTDKKFYTAHGSSQIKELFGKKSFSYPKPLDLVKNIIKRSVPNNARILDFFSGSATTAEAVARLNTEDNGTRSVVLVQVDEPTEGEYSTLCEVGEERIRLAGKRIEEEIESENQQLKLGEEPKPIPDIGFRVLRIDTSNFKDMFMTPGQATQTSVLDAIDNVKEGRTAEDILFQALPAFRIPYSAHIDTLDIHGKKVFDVNHGQLLACFDADVTNDVIEEIARRKPSYAVMRDLSFKDDSAAANFEELFKAFSPDTIRRVI